MKVFDILGPGDSALHSLSFMGERAEARRREGLPEPCPVTDTDVPGDHRRILWPLFDAAFPKSDPVIKEHILADTLHRYREPHRAYHTGDHLVSLAHQFNRYGYVFDPNRTSAIAAIFFHDVIYECQPGIDEHASADYARDAMQRMGVDAKSIDRTRKMIIASSNHKPGNDVQLALFLDMDMSVLSAAPDIYDLYAKGIEKEYCTKLWMLSSDFRRARGERFLVPTLNARRIFHTDAYMPLTGQARKNMTRELRSYGLLAS